MTTHTIDKYFDTFKDAIKFINEEYNKADQPRRYLHFVVTQDFDYEVTKKGFSMTLIYKESV